MVQRTDTRSDSQQPSPVTGGLIDPTLFNMPASQPDMAADSNNLGHLRPQHAQAGQNLEVPSGTVLPTDPMLYQQFGNVIGSGHHPNQVISMGYGQYAGLTDNASPMPEYIEPGWINPQAMLHQAGDSRAYGAYNMEMNQMAPEGLEQPDSLTVRTIANTDPKEQQGRRGRKTKRWTPKMDQRLESLKASHETHETIARTLETEFPSAEGLEPLNPNMVSKRLKELRETAGATTAVQICVNRVVPKALPIISDEIARLTGSEGLEELENERAEIELELRAHVKKIVQNRMLARRRDREAATAAGRAASHVPTRVVKSTGRSGGRARGA